MPTHQFQIFADYHQFYLADDGVQPFMPEDITKEDIRRRLWVAPHIMVVQPARNMTVPVSVEIADAAPADDFAAWDHVAECSLALPSGRIVIAGCTDYLPECARIPITPGVYRARVHYGKLDTLSDDGLDGDDHYHITLWPAPAGELLVLKQHRPALKPLAPEPILRAALATVGWGCIAAQQVNQIPDGMGGIEGTGRSVMTAVLEAVKWIPTLLIDWRPDSLAKLRQHLATLTPGGFPPTPDLAAFFEERLKDFGNQGP